MAERRGTSLRSRAEGAADQTSARRAREEIYKGAVDNAGRNRLTLAAILNRPSHRVPVRSLIETGVGLFKRVALGLGRSFYSDP